MDTSIPGTFIPHDAADSSGGGYRSQSGLADLLLLISIVLFVASAALAGGVFVYGQYLDTANASKFEQLKHAKAAFEPTLISKLTRLSDRMASADMILGNHFAPSMFFDALQAATLSTVSFSGLDMQSSDTHGIAIRMSGVAKSVNSIALQADLFSKNGVIKDPIFSGIDREIDGVHFQLTAEVDAKAISFSRFLNGSTQAAGAATPQQPTVRSPFGLPAGDSSSSAQQ